MKLRSELFGVALMLLVVPSVGAQSGPLDGFDRRVADALRDFEHPGMAIAIVRNDSVVFAKGFGVRALGQATAVDVQTMFAIGSSSKAFTGLSVAMLVDEGKMRWDEPVATYLPGFRLKDPYVSQILTMADALTHRSGLPRSVPGQEPGPEADVSWLSGQFDSEELIRRLRHVEPAGSFRVSFGYQNLMYLVAGTAVAKVSGLPWEEFVTRRIFAPLGMSESNLSVVALSGRPNVAQPHARINDTLRVIGYRNLDHIAPAGSINSNVLDMAKWLRFQLAGGKVAGKALLGARAFEETRTPQLTMRRGGGPNREGYFAAYGMGWFLQDYRGRFVVHHGGNIDGMSAMVAFMPDEQLGVVVLTNMQGSPIVQALAYEVFDRYLGLPPKDRLGEIKQNRLRMATRAKEAATEAEARRVKGTRPSLALENYVGVYTDSANGDIRVALENGKLVVRYGPLLTADLEHWQFDTFQARWRSSITFTRTMMSFELSREGTASRLVGQYLGTFARRPIPD